MEIIREGGFGAALRNAREAAGVNLRELSDNTKIQVRYIEALEAEDWPHVPKGVIGRGFVRLIARELGADQEQIMRLYCASRGEEPPRRMVPTPETNWRVGADKPVVDPRILLAAAVAVLVVAVVGVLLWSPWSAKTAPAQRGGDPQAAAVHRLEIRPRENTAVDVEIQGLPRERHEMKAGDAPFAIELSKPVTIEAPKAGALVVLWDGTELKTASKPESSFKIELPKDLEALKP